MEEIIKLAESHNQLAQQAHQQYEPMVNSLIATKTSDVNQISHTLDFMLDFCFDDQILQLYRKLCRYMYGLDQESAAFYVNAYRDMWDEEGKMFGNDKKEVI